MLAVDADEAIADKEAIDVAPESFVVDRDEKMAVATGV
jgi:hypothetical protein